MKNFSLLFEKKCINCHQKTRYKYLLCKDCYEQLAFVDGYRNIRDCDCYFSLLHQGLTKKLIYDYKLNKREVIKYTLSDIVTDKILEKNLQDYILLKVPSTKKSINTRGFDHVDEIVKEVQKNTKMQYIPDGIIKVKPTQKQHNLSQFERMENLRGAFEVKEDFSQSKILVVDDIVTTKSTLIEIKNMLDGNYRDLKFITISSKSNEKSR